MSDITSGENILESAEDIKGKLVTWLEAEAYVNRFFSRYWATLSNELEVMLRTAEDDFRFWQFKRIAGRIVSKQWALAQMQLFAMLLPQNRKKRGMTIVQTTRFKVLRQSGSVEIGNFNGHYAWRRKPGRPPLTAQQAQRGAVNSIEKKRAGNKTGTVHKDRKPMPPISQFIKTPGGKPRPFNRNSGFGKTPPRKNPEYGQVNAAEVAAYAAAARKELLKFVISELGTQLRKYFTKATGLTPEAYAEEFLNGIASKAVAVTGHEMKSGYTPRFIGF